MRNKHFLYLFLCLSCVALALSSCKDDEHIEGDHEPWAFLYPYNDYLSAEGGTVVMRWTHGFEPGYSVGWGEWVQDKNNNYRWTVPSNLNKSMELGIDSDTLKGDWFEVIQLVHGSGLAAYSDGVKVTLLPNTTGKKRYLMVLPKQPYTHEGTIYQDCEEPENDPDGNEE